MRHLGRIFSSFCPSFFQCYLAVEIVWQIVDSCNNYNISVLVKWLEISICWKLDCFSDNLIAELFLLYSLKGKLEITSTYSLILILYTWAIMDTQLCPSNRFMFVFLPPGLSENRREGCGTCSQGWNLGWKHFGWGTLKLLLCSLAQPFASYIY